MLNTGRGTQEMKEMIWCVCVCVCLREREAAAGPLGVGQNHFDFAKKQKQPDLMRQLCASALHYSHKNKRVFSVYLVSNSRNKLLHRAANRAVFICLNRQCIKCEYTHTCRPGFAIHESTTWDWGCMKVKPNQTEITPTERLFFWKPGGKVTF